jgi:hypothetical protein
MIGGRTSLRHASRWWLVALGVVGVAKFAPLIVWALTR